MSSKICSENVVVKLNKQFLHQDPSAAQNVDKIDLLREINF